MAIENNGPEAAYPGPAQDTGDVDEGHGSGLEQPDSEPTQGTDDERPEDWNPPPAGTADDADIQSP